MVTVVAVVAMGVPPAQAQPDALDGQLRIALTVAAQLCTRFARIREELARTRQAQTEQQNRELQARFDAERAAMRAELAPVCERSWWDSANVEQIAGAHETATAWHGIDPEADRAGECIAEEVRDRYGLDVHCLDAHPAAVRDALVQSERTRSEAAASRGESAFDVAEAEAFLTATETLDRAAEERQRRVSEHDKRATEEEALGIDPLMRSDTEPSALEGIDLKVVDARMTTAADQARHPREAVTFLPKSAKARKPLSGQGQQHDRHLGR